MKLTYIFSIGLLAVVAGCGPEALQIEQEPINVNWKPGASTKIERFQTVTFRSYTAPDSKTSPSEVSNATCNIDDHEYSTSFNTPAIVKIPFKGKARSSDLVVSCAFNGRKSHETLSVYNISGQERYNRTINSGSNYGLIGALISAPIAASNAKDRPDDIYGYPEMMRIDFKAPEVAAADDQVATAEGAVQQ